MRRVESVLDLGEERADADDLRSQRESDQEEPGQYRGRAHFRILSLAPVRDDGSR
jgi:hypothetical protein